MFRRPCATVSAKNPKLWHAAHGFWWNMMQLGGPQQHPKQILHPSCDHHSPWIHRTFTHVRRRWPIWHTHDPHTSISPHLLSQTDTDGFSQLQLPYFWIFIESLVGKHRLYFTGQDVFHSPIYIFFLFWCSTFPWFKPCRHLRHVGPFRGSSGLHEDVRPSWQR